MGSNRVLTVFGVRVPLLQLAAFLGLAYLNLIVGSLLTPIDEWYQGLEKPAWTPPGWLIGAVWTALYTLTGIASALAWNGSDGRVKRRTFAILLGANLVLNAAWSLFFFTLHQIGAALIEILVLVLSTWTFAWAAYARNRPAGYLLIPYCLWVAFAAFLNFTFWRLNP